MPVCQTCSLSRPQMRWPRPRIGSCQLVFRECRSEIRHIARFIRKVSYRHLDEELKCYALRFRETLQGGHDAPGCRARDLRANHLMRACVSPKDRARGDPLPSARNGRAEHLVFIQMSCRTCAFNNRLIWE